MRGGRVEIFAVLQLGRADGVEDDVLGLVVGGGGFAVGADDGNLFRQALGVGLNGDAGMRRH